jgi:hypothetical protein
MVAIQQAYKRSPLAAMMWSPLSALRVIRATPAAQSSRRLLHNHPAGLLVIARRLPSNHPGVNAEEWAIAAPPKGGLVLPTSMTR